MQGRRDPNQRAHRCHSSRTPKRLLIHENARVPTPTTTHVATVRHKASVPVNSQIARIDAPTAMKRQIAVIQNENDVTRRGLRKPRAFFTSFGTSYTPTVQTVCQVRISQRRQCEASF